MKKNHIRRVATMLTTLVLAVGISSLWAAGMQRLPLTPGPDGGDAKGEATIVDKNAATKEIIIAAQGLKPNAMYTVWVVNMKPKMDMAGVGTGDYAFKSDATGRGQFIGTFPAADLAKWQILEVAHHPDGDSKNMKNIGVVLTGALKQ
jgi:hypothetical protein